MRPDTIPHAETWTSPDGVRHCVPAPEWSTRWPGGYAGTCATCGRVHDVTHAQTQRMHGDGQACAVQPQDWPYECDAKDKYPDHEVYRCTVHGVWWHEPRARR